MAKDYARKNGANPRRSPARKKQPARTTAGGGNGLRWYGAGVLTGIFLSFLFYLGTLPPAGAPSQPPAGGDSPQADSAPKPRFDFYTMLPEQTIETDVAPAEQAPQPGTTGQAGEYYLLQAGSFRQREDADRRRAELLLLGLEPRIEETSGDNGRWFRVYLGPFESRSKMSKARSLTAAQNIDTLLLKRAG